MTLLVSQNTSSLLQNILVPGLVVLGIALLLGGLIITVAHFFQLPSNPTKDELLSALPGANCGGCGYPGCEGYAQYLAEGGKDTTLCTAGGPDCAAELAAILGVAPTVFEAKVAVLLCQGTQQHTQRRYEYLGTQTCNAAHGLLGGPGACTYGCLGFGDCIGVCAFGALKIVDGIVQIDPNECTACGQCVKICPKELLQLLPRSAKQVVACSNSWPGARTKQNCSVGCIGCRRCEKTCPVSAITLDKPLAKINQQICTRCGECEKVCPTHSISSLKLS